MVGGGNTAVEEALYLSNLAAQRDRHPPPRRIPRQRILQERPAPEGTTSRCCSGSTSSRRSSAEKRKAPLPPSVTGLRCATFQDRRGVKTWPVDAFFGAIGHSAWPFELLAGKLRQKPGRAISGPRGFGPSQTSRRIRGRRMSPDGHVYRQR